MRQPASLALAIVPVLLLAGCSGGAEQAEPAAADEPAALAIYEPDFGSNEIWHEETDAAPGHELIVADLRLPPDAVGETHWHPWNEYLYIIGGTAVLEIAGEEPRTLVAGDKVIIPRHAVHTPKAGPEGVRAIVSRVHVVGDPVTVPASEAMPPE